MFRRTDYLLKIAEIFCIFENSKADRVATWFNQSESGRPRRRLSSIVYSPKIVFSELPLVKKTFQKNIPLKSPIFFKGA